MGILSIESPVILTKVRRSIVCGAGTVNGIVKTTNRKEMLQSVSQILAPSKHGTVHIGIGADSSRLM